MMIIDWQFLPTEVTEDDLTFIEDPKGGYTAYITEYPSIVEEGDTKEEALQKIKELIKQLNILR